MSGSCRLVYAPNILRSGGCSPTTLKLLLGLLVSGIVESMLGKLLIIGGIVALCGLILIFQATSPSAVGPLGILAVFVFFYIFSVCVITPMALFFSKIQGRLVHLNRRTMSSLSFRRAYYYASVIALIPTILLAIRTVGEVGVYDIALVFLFVVVACIYISKRVG